MPTADHVLIVASAPPEASDPQAAAPRAPGGAAEGSSISSPRTTAPAREHQPAVSIGRLDVIFEAPSPAKTPRTRPAPKRTRGFAAYAAARRGQRRS